MSIFEQFASKKGHRAPEEVSQKSGHQTFDRIYTYKDAKATGNWDLDRIRTFLKTEINAEPNGDPEQTWYSVDVGDTHKDGRFYALKSHLGRKKQKTIKKAYNVDELVTYFFGPICADDFNGYSQSPETWARRQNIWNQFYSRQAWVIHKKGPKPEKRENVFEKLVNSSEIEER